MCEYINHENEVLRAEINNLKSQISSQDDADVESSESESNDNDNRPGKKRKVARRQIDQSDDDSETDEENARTEMKDYDKTEVLNILKDTRYHSPEDSETDKEQPDGKRKIIIYNLSWHSDEAYKTQNMPVDTDFSGPDTPAENRESQLQTDDNTQTEHND
ncbi:unnamed protein product [Rhizophagus irregularis]|uniref:Uncharacterized protein n=1 Tax=Rhizophagus irregularis TaxID=588596 RepID=A0A915ZY37_9GLOM|nr:unnamed protein product [Rhizophagus irregularis]